MKVSIEIIFNTDVLLVMAGKQDVVKNCADRLRAEFPSAEVEVSLFSLSLSLVSGKKVEAVEKKIREIVNAVLGAEAKPNSFLLRTEVVESGDTDDIVGLAIFDEDMDDVEEPATPTPTPTPTPTTEGGDPKLASLLARLRGGEKSGDPVAEETPTEEPKSGKTSSKKKEKEEGKNARLTKLAAECKDLAKRLAQDVKGQDNAIKKLVDGYFKMRTFEGLGKKKGARATFLFAGPSGVGKTMLAELFAQELKLPYLRVDMSEYSEDESHCSFNGLNPSYKAATEGKVTGFVKRQPKCVILFDEIEKAHMNTLYLFYQMLDRGELEDIYLKEEISFRDAILIFTSNAGHNLYDDPSVFNLSSLPDKTVTKAIRTDINPLTKAPFFPDALVSRLAAGTIVMFNHLEPFALFDILKSTIDKKVASVQDSYEVDMKIGDDVISTILFGDGGYADARSLTARGDKFVADELRQILGQFTPKELKKLSDKKLSINFTVDLPRAPLAVQALFENKQVKVLVVCDKETKEKIPTVDSVEFVFAHSIKEAKKLVRTDVSFVLVDIFLKMQEEEHMPASLDDVISDGVEFVQYMRDYCADMPFYVFRKEADGYEAAAYDPFLAIGAKGLISFNAEEKKTFVSEMLRARKNSLIGEASYKLMRSSMVLGYDSAQYFSDDKSLVEVRLQRMALSRSVHAEDEDSIVSDMLRPTVKFSDIIGAEDAKSTLREFITFLSNARAYTARGIRPPRGVLFYGPPGTGKTMIAKALAGETDVAFIQKNSTEFLKSFVGEGPKSVRDMFRMARKYAPAIIFIDEVDAFAKTRTGGSSSHSAEEILNAFLSEMDGFTYDEKRPVLVVCATNYDINDDNGSRRVLDPAFVRRFDRKIKIDLPSTKERLAFLEYYLKKHEIETVSKETMESLAMRSYGCSPADLEMVVELAIRNAKGGDLTDKLLTEAFDMERFGDINDVSKEGLLQTTYHEAGHTLVSYLCGEKPTFVTNISRSNFGGYMLHEIDDQRTTFTKQELLDRICCSLAGRVAELIVYGDERGMTTGASSDLKNANNLAAEIVNRYAMNGTLVVLDREKFGDEVGKMMYLQVEKILNEQFERAKTLITKNRAKLEKLTEELMKKNSLTKDEILAILE